MAWVHFILIVASSLIYIKNSHHFEQQNVLYFRFGMNSTYSKASSAYHQWKIKPTQKEGIRKMCRNERVYTLTSKGRKVGMLLESHFFFDFKAIYLSGCKLTGRKCMSLHDYLTIV